MNKRDFKRYVIECIRDVPLEKQGDELMKMQDCIKEIRSNLSKKINKNYFFCSKCNKYYPQKKWETISEVKVDKGVPVYRDCGYGDDDKIADITYRYFYYVCPKCGEHKYKERWYISECNRRDRYGKSC